jgi:hypothetical protein
MLKSRNSRHSMPHRRRDLPPLPDTPFTHAAFSHTEPLTPSRGVAVDSRITSTTFGEAMSGWTCEQIQQRISANRSMVYIISASIHSGVKAQGKGFCMQISRADVADLIYFMAIATSSQFQPCGD